MADAVIRIKPYYYIHILDNNTNVTRVEVGPATLTRQDHEKLVAGPESMIMIPPRHYCIIANPVERSSNHPIMDKYGQVKIRWGDEEIRFEQEPFPLYPGEKLYGKVSPLQVVAPNSALRLRAIRDFEIEEVIRKAGDEWLFSGPGTYIPRVEVQVVEIVKAIIVKPQQALKLRARRELLSKDGIERKAGEEWLIRTCGAYLPSVDEELIDTVQAYVLTPLKALHLRANTTFTDIFNVERKAGEEWLVTSDMAETHIPDVYEIVVGEVPITTLTNRQWTVVVDPIGKDGRPQLGKRELRKGELCFFLRPGERLEEGVKNVYVLGEQEALLLRSKEEYVDVETKKKHMPGDRWMVYGSCDFIPPVEVEVIERRRSIPLDTNEGVYVRDIKSGKVRVEIGKSYMLEPNEELWPKELPAVVEELLKKDVRMAEVGVSATAARDKTRVVAYRAPHNSAVQVYDYKEKRARVVFGPELVVLGPDEHFTVVSLSGGKPKQPHLIKTLALLLGPDFMTDVVIVETSDHARLSLKLSYNWQFEIHDPKEGPKLFQVPDFVGDACKAIAARIRGAVAAVSFELFHKTSAKLIREAVFGGVDNNKFIFKSNNLVISNVDIQSVEPVDQKTRDSLQKSVQLAIEITTKSQEANARHEAERLEQEAKGRLDRQKLNDEAEAEKARKDLLRLQAQSSTVETTGHATAEARARADSAQIEGQSAVEQANLRTQASKIKSDAELKIAAAKQEQELEHQQAITEMDVTKARALADIEVQKFKDTVKAIGPETIKAIAQAGPEMQLKLLSGLGLKSVMITDGNSPINLFSTANGLVSMPHPQ
jgi:major vault protein